MFGQEILTELSKASSLDFNVFKVREVTSGNELVITLLNLIQREELISGLNLDENTLFNFLKQI